MFFNLGAVYSQMGLAADRSSPAGLKQACNCFQSASGAFAFLRDNVSMKAAIGGATVDVSAECAGMLDRLMLAQAQECFFEKVISDAKPPGLCSKVARQVCTESFFIIMNFFYNIAAFNMLSLIIYLTINRELEVDRELDLVCCVLWSCILACSYAS